MPTTLTCVVNEKWGALIMVGGLAVGHSNLQNKRNHRMSSKGSIIISLDKLYFYLPT